MRFDPSACKSENGLVVALGLGSSALVKVSRLVAGLDADECGSVEDALQAAVVTPWAVQIARNPSGIPRNGSDTAVAGEVIGRGERRHVTARSGEELGAEQRSDSGHAQQDLSGSVAAKSRLDDLVDAYEVLVEAEYSMGHLCDQLSSPPLPGSGVC